jgi:hypothetical protein
VEFLGRRDQQVKLRGFRIELGEIETILRNHPLVREASVLVHGSTGDRQLIGYVTMDGPAATPQEIRRYLQQQLPHYMVPAVIIPLREFPLTPNGKIDPRALPAPSVNDSSYRSHFAAPRSAIERLIASVWREALGVDRVGLGDNFFDLGGHSLLLVQVHSRLSRLLDCPFSVVELFHFPTLETLARRLRTAAPAVEAAKNARLDQVDERMAKRRKARAQRVPRRRT